MNLTKEFYRIKEVCHLLDIDRATLMRWEKAGSVPPLTRLSRRCVGYARETIQKILTNAANCR